jgi:hypothetical protein
VFLWPTCLRKHSIDSITVPTALDTVNFAPAAPTSLFSLRSTCTTRLVRCHCSAENGRREQTTRNCAMMNAAYGAGTPGRKRQGAERLRQERIESLSPNKDALQLAALGHNVLRSGSVSGSGQHLSAMLCQAYALAGRDSPTPRSVIASNAIRTLQLIVQGRQR